ncbi:MAG: tetratricopeptide repeat protein [Euryarchaeota archaeon]|nr:tetratricopeptide repeat protein [Euryarchaeota archaeon]
MILEHARAVDRIRSIFSASFLRRGAPCSDLDTTIRRGDSFLWEGQLDEALGCYRQAARTGRGCVAIWKKEGLVLGMMGRYMEAIASLDKATKIDPRDPYAWMHRGFNLWRLRRWDAALTSFEKAILIDPDDAYARHCRAVTLKELETLVSSHA